MMQKNCMRVSVLALTMAVVPACATKKLVRTEVGTVNAKVDTLSTALEATQERTQQTETQTAAVDAKAEAAGRSAVDARAAADAAQLAADSAGNATKVVDGRVTAVGDQRAPADLRGHAERRPGQLPLRRRGAARRRQSPPRPDGQPAEGGPEGHLHRDRGPHRQRRARPRTTSTWASSAPTWSSGISTNSTRCRCTRST